MTQWVLGNNLAGYPVPSVYKVASYCLHPPLPYPHLYFSCLGWTGGTLPHGRKNRAVFWEQR